MSQESEFEADERTTLPIERSFPIERVNEIASKEGRAKMYYRPIYTMHKWWARRLGCVFRAISLYSLLDDPEKIEVHEPGENATFDNFSGGSSDIQALIENVDMTNPESLWKLYPNDVQIKNKKILDPFMGGGTSLVEASRLGAEVDGYDLNPVAWFVTKKQLESGQTDIGELEAAFEQVKQDVADEITQYYKTPCPNGDHDADVMYNFWVKEIDCVSCGHEVPLFNDYRVAKGRFENDDEYNVLCPDCGSIVLVDDWREDCSCSECGNGFIPKEGNVSRGGKYSCPDCGQKYGITDAIQEQGGYELRLYGIEYYCPECDEQGRRKSEVKGYKPPDNVDRNLIREARKEWQKSDELHEYVPDEEIPPGHMTAERNPIFDHGYETWSDMFNQRQLLCLAKLLQAIDDIGDQNVKEYLLLTFSETLNYNTMMTGYNPSYNKATNIFKSNSFDPHNTPLENNPWGTKYGTGTFEAMWDMMLSGIEYANSPTERYIEDGETVESEPFSQPIGENTTVHQGDARLIDAQGEYDAVITDPPYYDNIIYSEVSDYFYVWQKILLEDEYDGFDQEKTPRAESIVANPYLGKGSDEFESELHESFSVIHEALKDDGILAFTYHHSDSESWGELLASLCNVGFEVTATYPISADENKFIGGDAVSFDIIIVARPANDRDPVSWRRLRQQIYKTARRTRQRLEESRDLARGDIGVVEMGRCFHEYSKHHGKVRKNDDVMTAKEVVDAIYGIIQDASQVGAVDVFVDLLETTDPDASEVNKLCRSASTTPEELEEARLYGLDSGEFWLGTWDDERRQAHIKTRIESIDGGELTALDKVQFLRYRYEQGRTVSEYVEQWNGIDDVRELAERLANATGDDIYRRVLGDRDVTSYD